jgi:hypothetical protein
MQHSLEMINHPTAQDVFAVASEARIAYQFSAQRDRKILQLSRLEAEQLVFAVVDPTDQDGSITEGIGWLPFQHQMLLATQHRNAVHPCGTSVKRIEVDQGSVDQDRCMTMPWSRRRVRTCQLPDSGFITATCVRPSTTA